MDFEIEGKWILEVGCGLGLFSLLFNFCKVDILAIDYYLEVGGFFVENVRLNSGDKILFLRMGWVDL